MNITNNITNSSVVVQWDTVDDVQDTNYTVTWAVANESNVTQVNTEQTSYTLTGLTLNTVYNINITATNKCGRGEEFRTTISFSEVTSPINSGISPTITTVNRTFTIVPMITPTSVVNIAKSSFGTVTPPTATTTVVPVNATTDSVVFPTPTTYFIIATVNHTLNVVPTTTPTSVTGSEGPSTAESSFSTVTHTYASTTVVVPITATSDSVFPTPTTYFTDSKLLYVYTQIIWKFSATIVV